MSKDIPTRERSTRERGTYAGHNEDPTLASYLSSLFFLLSVPTFVALAYGGFYAGYYGEGAIVPVFGGLLVFAITVAFAAMHFKR
ncbi:MULTISPECIES: hypothetical protein [Haloprofundus]|uniref:hypothetical protein n=1 Tax=Haloprofundus TaxID=1911573 RepID=UPI000E44EEF3|nr:MULTISPECIES: hypothetical protein [Haloprofundus]QCJ47774.1 hypothetical protein FCF25_11885 [Haloprofundus sp. MHR1]